MSRNVLCSINRQARINMAKLQSCAITINQARTSDVTNRCFPSSPSPGQPNACEVMAKIVSVGRYATQPLQLSAWRERARTIGQRRSEALGLN